MKNNKRIKILGFIIGLFTLFLIPRFSVDAAQKVKLVGESNAITPGSTVKYYVNVESDDDTVIMGFQSQFVFDTNVLKLTDIQLESGWEGETEVGPSPMSLVFSNKTGVTGNFKVATLVFKVEANVNSSATEISINDARYSKKAADDEISEDNVLPFDEEGSVTKLTSAVKSTDNTLKELKIDDKLINNFNSNVFEYDISVEADKLSVKISATPNSSKATLKEGNGNRIVNLEYGSNVIIVTVVSESGSEKNYTIHITREDDRSTDTSLASILIDGVEIPNFKGTIYKYNVKKYKLTADLTVTAVTHDEMAKYVVVPPKEIVTGDNTYTIVVTSEKGDSATYTVIINNITSSINKKLKVLSIKGYNIDFDLNNNRYEILYNNKKFKDLHIYFTTVASSDEVTAVLSPDINNDKDALSKLKPGDEIKILVTGIDGETAEYTIVILKDTRISFFLVLELFLMAVIIIVIIIIAIQRKKNNSKKDMNNPENYKTTKVKKTIDKVNDEKKDIKLEKKANSEAVIPIVEKPKKRRRFSIFEDEYEEVEIEVDDNDLSATKELTDEELNLRK